MSNIAKIGNYDFAAVSQMAVAVAAARRLTASARYPGTCNRQRITRLPPWEHCGMLPRLSR